MKDARAIRIALVLTLLSMGMSACGGGSSPSPSPTPTPTPQPQPPGPAPATATITITATGASPREVTVSAGGRVTFVNQNAGPHDMNSDPHPSHEDCAPMNAIGFLAAGQTRQTDAFPIARTCGFHDHNQPTNTSLQGRIVIQ